MADIRPNVFLIGVQKSATTSVYNWIVQHPDVCGPVSMKDTPFFIDDNLYSKGQEFLNKVYSKQFSDQKIILNGSAHNIYFEHALKRIKDYNTEAKLILILRNPVDRAISAYNFAKKRNLEDDNMIDSVNKEQERLKSNDLKVLSETTYIDHGLYYKQIMKLYEYFSPQRLLVLFYDDIRKDSENTIRGIYEFLEINSEFKPTLSKLNKTGEPRYKWIKNTIYNDSNVKKFLLKNIFDKIIPYDLKYRIKIFFLNLITKKTEKTSDNMISGETREYLLKFFIDDINNLEHLLDRDLSHWKN